MSPVFAKPVQLTNIRVWPSPEGTRVVLDLNKKIDYKVFTLSNPERVVVDLFDICCEKKIKLTQNTAHVKEIRYAVRDKKNLRIVLDLKRKLTPNHFLLAPNAYYGYRLVLDLNLSERERILALFEQEMPIEKALPKTLEKLTNKQAKQVKKYKSQKSFVVAIDAGHGGEDPGAVGLGGTREKTVVLAVAKYLAQYINQEPGMKAILIRRGDYYIGLYNRMARARRLKADFFVSIHADAAQNRQAKGASVYVLSERGASSAAAKFLAKSENQSDLIGGVNLKHHQNSLASVLLDMTQNASKTQSLEAAKYVLKSISHVAELHKPHVESAGFAVLKSPDVPSILVETGFISNPNVERLLRSTHHQKKIAHAIKKGICQFKAQKVS